MKRWIMLLITLVGIALSVSPVFSQDRDSGGKADYLEEPPVSPDDGFAALAGPGGNSIYEVFVSDLSGRYTARTAAGHPAGAGLNVLFGGSAGSPGTSYNTIRSYTSLTDYSQAGAGSSVFPFTNVSLDPFLTSTVAIAGGFRTTWNLPGGLASSDELLIVQDVFVSGTTFQNSRVGVTTQVTNTGSSAVQLGIRYLWDFQIASDDGPSFTPINPDGATLLNETQYAIPGFESYRIQDNHMGAPTFFVNGTATGPAAFGPTVPNRLQFACWPASVAVAFDYAISGADCSTNFGDTAVLYYFGATQISSLLLNPGQSVTVAEYLFATQPQQNTTPDAQDDAGTTPFNTPITIDVLANDIDLDGNTLTITLVTDPPNGTAVLNPDRTITYTPDLNFVGGDSFQYTVDDGNGGTDTATVTVTVQPPANNPPIAADDSASTSLNTPVTVAVLGNDAEPDGNPMTVSGVTGPANGVAAINLDNTVTYTPNPGFVGNDQFDYTVSDGQGGSDTATVFITVNQPQVCQPGHPNYNPEGDLSGFLHPETGYSSGQVTNTSTVCAYDIGIASYRKFDEIIDNQVLFHSNVAIIMPNSTVTLSVNLPDCAAQVDLFYGPVLDHLNGQRYGDRILDARHVGGTNYCVP